MKSTTIAFFDTATWEAAYLRRHEKAFRGHKALFFKEPLTAAHTPQLTDVEVISCFVQSKLPKEILEQLPKLKLLALRSTGFDNVDLIEAGKRGITVSNVPAYGDNTVAEHTFGLLLSLIRYINVGDSRSKTQDYTIKDLVGFDLKGKTIGILGGGRIGMNVAKIAHGFGMKVLVYDVMKNPMLKDILEFEYADRDTIYAHSDIITLHLPALPSTYHTIDMKAVKSMKKGVIFLNCGRGNLVDTNALQYGLENGIIAKAGLDVLEEEELLTHPHAFKKHTDDHKTITEKNEAIIAHPNVIFTSHNAFNTHEALRRIEECTLQNIESYLAGKPINIVRPH